MLNAKKNYPKSIGIIMDGNRRWARDQGLPIMQGHEMGYQKLKEVMRWAKELGVSTVYVYAFSTENWNREAAEVNYLMKLFFRMVGKDAKELIKEGIRIKFVGQIERFPLLIRKGINLLEKATAKFSGGNLVVCLSYGGRAEILAAAKKMLKGKTAKAVEKFTEQDFSRFLWTDGFADPELIIRTSGELRTSNFLLWQTVYSEWFFTETNWPAFSKGELEKILEDFSKREVRRGR